MTARLLPWLLLGAVLGSAGAFAWGYLRGAAAADARHEANTARAWASAFSAALTRERGLRAEMAELDARGAREEAEVRVETRTIVRTITEVIERDPPDPHCLLPADAVRVLNDARAASAD